MELKLSAPLGFFLFFIIILHAAAAAQQEEQLQRLDSEALRLAFQRLSPLPRTGTIYNVTLPPSLSSSLTKLQAVRLRSGSLRRHGLTFNEFTIPVQSLVRATSKYVVLLYRSFPPAAYAAAPPLGYSTASAVVGILAFDGSNLSSLAPASVSISSSPSSSPITAQFSATAPFCALFDQQGSSISNSSSAPSICNLARLVDCSLAIPAAAAPPAPAPVAAIQRRHGSSNSRKWKLGVGVAVGALALWVALALAICWLLAARRNSRIAKMQYAADRSETLETALIGSSRAPAAGAMRTRPALENDYVAAV